MEVIINNLRSILLVLGLLCFLGIVFWAYGKKAKPGFDEAAQLPLTEYDPLAERGQQGKEGKENDG